MEFIKAPIRMAAIAATVVAAACGASNKAPTQPGAASKVTLQPGSQQTPFTGLYVTLISVSNESRCPTGVTCVWQGDAEVKLGVSSDTLDLTAPISLHTGIEPRQAEARGYVIRLDSLKPYPNASSPIPQSEYRAFVTVTRK
jgi:hypothetical protein